MAGDVSPVAMFFKSFSFVAFKPNSDGVLLAGYPLHDGEIDTQGNLQSYKTLPPDIWGKYIEREMKVSWNLLTFFFRKPTKDVV